MEVAIGLRFNKIGFVVSGETVNVKVKILLCCVFRIYMNRKMGRKQSCMRKASFSLACMVNFGVQHTFKGSTDGKQLG